MYVGTQAAAPGFLGHGARGRRKTHGLSRGILRQEDRAEGFLEKLDLLVEVREAFTQQIPHVGGKILQGRTDVGFPEGFGNDL